MTPECTVILNDYKNSCESAEKTMNIISVSLGDLFTKMLNSVATLGRSSSIENLKLLTEGRDHLYNCYRGRSVYIHKCVPSGNRNYDQRKSDRGHEHAKNVFKKLWTIYNNDVKIMMSMVSETDLISQAIIDMRHDLSSQRLHDVTQFLTGIIEDERVTVIGKDKLRWSLYSKYTPKIEEYHRLLSACMFNQTMVLGVLKVLHFFEYHDLEIDYSRVLELIDRVSESDLLLSFLTLQCTDGLLRELIIQVGNQSYLNIPDMMKNLEDILEDPSLVSTLLVSGRPVMLDGITLTLSYLSLVLRMDETRFKLHKFHLSSIVKSGKDISSEWSTLEKMEKMTMVSEIVKSLGAKFVKSKGDHMFELFEEKLRHGVNNTTKLIRGDYKISEGGDVTIKTMGVVELTGINFVCLPLDTVHMKKFSVPNKVLGMNKVSRISRNRSIVPLEIPVRHFPEFTLTKIGDVNFVVMSE